MKTCPKCKEPKAVSQFSPSKQTKDGLFAWCRSCKADRQREYRQRDPENARAVDRAYYRKNPDKWVRQNRVQKYSMSQERFDSMDSEQCGKCAACGESYGDKPHVDHNHACCSGPKSCGVCVRALLCRRCNISLGAAGDNIDRLIGLAAYVLAYPLPFLSSSNQGV